MSTRSFLARGGRTALAAVGLALAAGAGAQTDAPADSRRSQEIAFGELPGRIATDAPFPLAAKATSGLPVTFEVVSGPATLDGRVLKLSGAPGLVIIRASQNGNDLFRAAAPQERDFVVAPKPEAPVIVASPVPATVGLGEPVVLEVQATGEPAPTLQWRRDGRPIMGAIGRTFTIPAAALADTGSYEVVATNHVGSARSAAVQVTVTKRHQTISFFPPATATVGQTVTLAAMASSGLPVHFQLVSGSANLAGAAITPTSSLITVVASQEGDGTYEAAPPVSQTILVQPVPPGQGSHF